MNDEPLEEVNIYEFDDEKDFTYKGKGGLRSQQIQTQINNQRFPRVSIRTVPIVNPEETDLINWASEPDEESSQEEPIEEDFSYQLFPVEEDEPVVEEESFQEDEPVEEESSQEDEPVVEETEWTIHSERLKRSTYENLEFQLYK